MNIIAKVVKETVLIPYRVAQGISAAIGVVVDDTPKKEQR